MPNIRIAINNFLDAQKKTADWSDPRYTPEALAEEREKRLQPARDALTAAVESSRGRSADSAAHREAVVARLRDTSDTNRLIARELAWQRLARRISGGESVDQIALDASALELEALSNLAPGELSTLGTSMVDRPRAAWQEWVDAVVVTAYADHPDNAQAFAPLAEKASEAEGELALVALGDALVAGRQPGPQVLNRVYQLDQDLYQRLVSDSERPKLP